MEKNEVTKNVLNNDSKMNTTHSDSVIRVRRCGLEIRMRGAREACPPSSPSSLPPPPEREFWEFASNVDRFRRIDTWINKTCFDCVDFDENSMRPRRFRHFHESQLSANALKTETKNPESPQVRKQFRSRTNNGMKKMDKDKILKCPTFC